MDTIGTYRFDPVDLEQIRLLGRLSPGQRIQIISMRESWQWG